MFINVHFDLPIAVVWFILATQNPNKDEDKSFVVCLKLCMEPYISVTIIGCPNGLYPPRTQSFSSEVTTDPAKDRCKVKLEVVLVNTPLVLSSR